jgi:hypothetical protein
MNSDRDTHCWVGCPIRTSTDQRLLAAPRGFSQRATSFIASWCQGIHRMPLSCSRSIPGCDPGNGRIFRCALHHARKPSTAFLPSIVPSQRITRSAHNSLPGSTATTLARRTHRFRWKLHNASEHSPPERGTPPTPEGSATNPVRLTFARWDKAQPQVLWRSPPQAKNLTSSRAPRDAPEPDSP